MENYLVCNFNKCRKTLTSQAVITSCSHIFCKEHGARELEKSLSCPACGTQLAGRLDKMTQNLNPSEEYKSMILAGLKPETVVEICTRAISFWSYQVQNETLYQEHVCKKAREKSSRIEQHSRQVYEKAQLEINAIRAELQATKKEIMNNEKAIADLNEKLVQKTRQLQAMYDAVRRKQKRYEDSALRRQDNNARDFNYGFPYADVGFVFSPAASTGKHNHV